MPGIVCTKNARHLCKIVTVPCFISRKEPAFLKNITGDILCNQDMSTRQKDDNERSIDC